MQNCNTLMFPSSVYNTIICGMHKLIQPTISFKILVQNQDTFSILEILLKVSLKHHKPKPSQIHCTFFKVKLGLRIN